VRLGNLAIIPLGDSVSRLLPLTQIDANIALFTDLALPAIPSEVEIQPLSNAPDALHWADFIALDVPIDQLDLIPHAFKLDAYTPLPDNAQALVTTPMPCATLAECGVCAIKSKPGYLLACKDGPVFNLKAIKTEKA
jgi:hypothetical protein